MNQVHVGKSLENIKELHPAATTPELLEYEQVSSSYVPHPNLQNRFPLTTRRLSVLTGWWKEGEMVCLCSFTCSYIIHNTEVYLLCWRICSLVNTKLFKSYIKKLIQKYTTSYFFAVNHQKTSLSLISLTKKETEQNSLSFKRTAAELLDCLYWL